jgi:alpha/beta hydrolase family protein
MIKAHCSRVTPLLLTLVLASPSAAAVTRLEIAERQPHAGGRVYGSVGGYERLRGRVHFAVSPKAAANRHVVDLELAPRNGQGQVEFSADLEMLVPADLTRCNGTVLYDVNNRGNRVCTGQFGEEFLLRQGYVVVWSGWIAEVLPGGNRLCFEAPAARDGSRPITGLVRAEMTPNAPAERRTIAQWENQGSYPPTERGLREAALTWRLREADPRVPIPRSQWRLEQSAIQADGGRGVLPKIELVLSGGFRPGYIYELIYEAQDPVVQGLGLAGIRDLVSYLKHGSEPQNPLRRADGGTAADRAIGFGVSQSGRCLRLFLHDGFNADEQGRTVFDGLFPHVAGAGQGFFNHRFASPTRHAAQHDNHLYPVDLFPFTYGDEKDPFTGRTDGLLRRARASGTVPKVFHTQTSAEYWTRSGSLVHTDPLGKRDAVLPPEVRIYAFGGAQHGAGSGLPAPRGSGQLPANPTDYRPLMRGLLTAMNGWIRGGVSPPPSQYPRIADGTLAGWRERESGWKALPGVRYPEVIQQPPFLDYGPDFSSRRRITRHPPLRKGDYHVLVPAYGLDNNEQGMLFLPSISVPVATYTGWNLRDRSIGADQELLSLTGSYVPFVRTAAERMERGDPRPALLERYAGFEIYLDLYAQAARKLIEQRYLLEEDLPGLLELARKHRDRFTP